MSSARNNIFNVKISEKISAGRVAFGSSVVGALDLGAERAGFDSQQKAKHWKFFCGIRISKLPKFVSM